MVWIEKDIIIAEGHSNITACHKSTLEITKDNYLTKRGDCIVGINANKSVADFNQSLKNILKRNDTLVIIVLLVKNLFDVIVGRGSMDLILSNKRSLVIRKSNFIDDRTIMIWANKAAKDIDRKIINLLRQGAMLKVLIIGINMGPRGVEPLSSPREGDIIPLDHGPK